MRTMAGKQKLPTPSGALRDLDCYLDQYLLFKCLYVLCSVKYFSFNYSTFTIFNATLRDDMAVKSYKH